MTRSQVLWRMVALASGAAAGAVTQMGLRALWRRAWRAEPPGAGGHERSQWGDALVWAAASGVAGGVAKIVGERGGAEVWRAATGEYPPGQPSPSSDA